MSLDLRTVQESDYKANESFGDVLDAIISKSSRKLKAKRLSPYDGRWPKWTVIDTPAINLSLSTNIGGIPRGRMIHLWGEKHAGKSYLAYSIIAQAQKQGIYCVLFDAEAASSGHLLQSLGVDLDNLPVIVPDDLEDMGRMLKESMEHRNVLAVVDSIASSDSGAEMEKDFDKASRIGQNAQIWKKILNNTRGALEETGSTMLLINQVRKKMGAGQYEYPYKNYGGESLNHAMDMSFLVKKVSPSSKGPNNTSKPGKLKEMGYNLSKVVIEKNRFSSPSEAELIFYPGLPYDPGMSTILGADAYVAPGTEVTYGQMADNVFLVGKRYNPDTGRVINGSDYCALRVDPWMAAALESDEVGANTTGITPDPNFDPDAEVPKTDIENAEYITVPVRHIYNVMKWLNEHPHVVNVINERMLNGLENRDTIVQAVAGVPEFVPSVDDPVEEPADDPDK